MYVLADGDRVTVVDCGVWRPDLPDGGLAALEAGLEGAGYALRDVSRIVVTHAHIDHYGLAGRLMELTGAELAMHAMTDLDCEKYRHPDTARARRRDTYADHGVSEAERTDLADHLTRWLPYLYSVVEASRRLRGGEELVIGGDRWEVVHTPGHSLGHVCLWSPGAPGAAVRGSPAARDHPAGHVRARLRRRPAAQLPRLAAPHRRPPSRARATRATGVPFGDAVGRIDAILRNKVRRLETDPPGDPGPALHGHRARRPAGEPRRSSPTSASSRSPRRSRTSPTCAGRVPWSGGPGRTASTSGTPRADRTVITTSQNEWAPCGVPRSGATPTRSAWTAPAATREVEIAARAHRRAEPAHVAAVPSAVTHGERRDHRARRRRRPARPPTASRGVISSLGVGDAGAADLGERAAQLARARPRCAGCSRRRPASTRSRQQLLRTRARAAPCPTPVACSGSRPPRRDRTGTADRPAIVST